MPRIQQGTVIAGKYRLDRALARGGMGSVWVATHTQLEMMVAIKFMDAAAAASEEARTRFEREAKAAALIQSPHVVQVHDYGVEEGTPYIAMELLRGEDLGNRLRREKRLPLGEIAQILTQAAKALRKAHEAGLIHRDLKPANIFLARIDDEGDEMVKVLDFGVVKNLRVSSVAETTQTGIVLGSVHYMSPEQARGSREIDHRSDIWSLGVLAYRALVGQHPFPGEQIGDLIVKICSEPIPNPSELAPDLGPEVDRFFKRALSRNLSERFQSAREFAAELSMIAGVGPIGATGAWPLAPAARPIPPTTASVGPASTSTLGPIIREVLAASSGPQKNPGAPPQAATNAGRLAATRAYDQGPLPPAPPLEPMRGELPAITEITPFAGSPLPGHADAPAAAPMVAPMVAPPLFPPPRASVPSFNQPRARSSGAIWIALGGTMLTLLIGGWLLAHRTRGGAPTPATASSTTAPSVETVAAPPPVDPPDLPTSSAEAPSTSAAPSAAPSASAAPSGRPRGAPTKKVNATLGI